MIRLESGLDQEEVMDASIEAGAEDIEVNEDGSMTVTTDPDDYQSVLKEIPLLLI